MSRGALVRQKVHPIEAVRAHVEEKRCALVDGDLPVPGVPVERREDRRISERVDAVAHEMDRLRVPDRGRVELPIVYAEPGRAAVFGGRSPWAGLLRHRGFDYALR